MDKKKYDEIDETYKLGVGITVASIILMVLATFILIIIHVIIWRHGTPPNVKSTDLVVMLIEFILLSLLHEYIHAITYRIMGKLPKGTIKFVSHLPISIGVHYTEIVLINVRKWSAIMPTITICPIVLLIGLTSNSIIQTVMAGVMFSGGISDFYNVFKLRKYDSDCVVEDKIDVAGCIVYVPKM